jgi:hypothetical protein
LKNKFLDNDLKFDLGSMPKSEIDALFMHLLDMYDLDGSCSLVIHGNQMVSERLKIPVTQNKKTKV